MSLKINVSPVTAPKAGIVSFGAKNPLVGLSKHEVLTLLRIDTKGPISTDTARLCQKLTGSEEAVTKSVVQKCYDSFVNQFDNLKAYAKSIKKASQKNKDPKLLQKELSRVNGELDKIFTPETPRLMMKPVGEVIQKKTAQTIKLSKNDMLAILGQNPKEFLSHDTVNACKKMTGMANITADGYTQCYEALTVSNPLLKDIAANMRECVQNKSSATDIYKNYLKNRKRLDAVVESKEKPFFSIREVSLDKTRLEKEVQLQAEKSEKMKWIDAGHKQLEYVKAVSEKNADIAFVKIPSLKELKPQMLERRQEIKETLKRDEAIKKVRENMVKTREPIVAANPPAYMPSASEIAYPYQPKEVKTVQPQLNILN